MNDKEKKLPNEEGLKSSAVKGSGNELEQEKNRTDTAPDEFLSPKADTDQPMDGQVLNDAVLRGETHEDSTNLKPPDKQP